MITSFGMQDRTLLKVGGIGSLIAAVCCFTPVLVVLLSALGLSALVSWLDLVLFPTLILFLGLTLYAGLRLARRQAD